MKKYFIATMMLITLFALTRCIEEDSPDKKKPKELTLNIPKDSPSEVSMSSISQIRILSGNGDYTVEVGDPSKAEVRLSEDKTSLLVIAKML